MKKPSFHNAKTTLDFEIRIDDKIGMGIQIEDDQYRLFCWKKGLNENNLNNYFVKIGWLDVTFPEKASRKSVRTVFGNETSMTKNYCGYSGNWWIYQYYSVFKAFDNSYDKILEQLLRDFEKTIKILKLIL